jgi:hypothetical protein
MTTPEFTRVKVRVETGIPAQPLSVASSITVRAAG